MRGQGEIEEKEGKDCTPIMLLRDEQITLADFGLGAG